ncbi:MAG: hypothetical protein Q4F70_05605 [Clostridia bacterium]|nr:hypothetical protein [Clostridia bacterium]
MRGDLNDQFQRAQTASGEDNSQKIIVGAAIFLAFVFLAMVIAGLVFFVKTVDKFVEAEPETHINRELVTQVNELNQQLYPDVNTNSGSSNFQYGTVEGTNYYSEFSGIKFTPTSDWVLTSYAESLASSSPKDLTASSGNLSSSVIIQYESMKNYGYSSIDDAIASAKTIAEQQNNRIIDSKAQTKWGGNKFEGIIYEKNFSGYLTYYEVLCTQINGYCLKITISAGSEQDLSIVRAYFK